MRVTRFVLAASTLLAVVIAPTATASTTDQLTWAQVQAAAQAAQQAVTLDGGSVALEVTGKISFQLVTDYAPGGKVNRERYREAGMADSDPDEVTWTITKNGVESRYQPMPPLPKAGRYPTLRKASWVRLDPDTTTNTMPPILRLMIFDPLADISSGPANDAGIIEATWTHGIEGTPVTAVAATFTHLPTGALAIRTFATKDLNTTGPTSAQAVKIDFTKPRLTVPDFSSALPASYVKSALDAAANTTAAYYSMRNSAISARKKASTMTRPELVAFVRSEVAANEEFSHPPANPSTDTITNVPGGLRLTNHNAYSGQSTIWTLTVTPDKRLVLVKRTKPSKVTPAP